LQESSGGGILEQSQRTGPSPFRHLADTGIIGENRKERYPPVVHRVSTIEVSSPQRYPHFGVKVVEKGIAILSLVQVHLFHKDFSLSVDAYFIAGSCFVRTITIGEVRMVCLYGTLSPFQRGKAFTLLVLQSAQMRAASAHRWRASILLDAR